MEKLYSVTELAKELGVTPRAIRFYEAKGLITPQRAGGTRVYTHRDRGRLILILRGKKLGFSLREIKDYLDLYVVDTTFVEQNPIVTQRRAYADRPLGGTATGGGGNPRRTPKYRAHRFGHHGSEKDVQAKSKMA